MILIFWAGYGWNSFTISLARSAAAICTPTFFGPVTDSSISGAGWPIFVPVRPRIGFTEIPPLSCATVRPDACAACLSDASWLMYAVARPRLVGGLEIWAPLADSGWPR